MDALARRIRETGACCERIAPSALSGSPARSILYSRGHAASLPCPRRLDADSYVAMLWREFATAARKSQKPGSADLSLAENSLELLVGSPQRTRSVAPTPIGRFRSARQRHITAGRRSAAPRWGSRMENFSILRHRHRFLRESARCRTSHRHPWNPKSIARLAPPSSEKILPTNDAHFAHKWHGTLFKQ